MACASLHFQIKDEKLRRDLQSVENYYRNLRPVFTAAGFFQINQGLFSNFFSSIVSYLIILIQLKSVNLGISKTAQLETNITYAA